MVVRPVTTIHYYVEMKGITQAIFTECSTLQIETEVYEYKEGGVNTHVHRLPGRAKVGNITLKRGMARRTRAASGPWDSRLWDWYQQILIGRVVRTNMSIHLISDTAGERIATWNILDAYPVKWIGPNYKAGDNMIAVETLEIAHGGVTLG